MRLFVAIWLSDDVRRGLRRLQDGLRPRCPDVRWTPIEQMHVTVKFLGEVADSRAPEISSALESAAGRCEPFETTVAGTGCFPPRGEVRIVWAGMEDALHGAARCAGQVEEVLEGVGFSRERRPFSPHITIGRVRADQSNGKLRSVVESAKFESIAQSVGELRLMSSVLSGHGSEYATVASFRLGTAAAGSAVRG